MFDIVLGRTPKDTEKLGTKGAVFIGKQYVQMGENYSLSNPIYMDVSRAHAMLICGKRGGGKCLLGDSEITLKDGSKKTIQEIYDTYSFKGGKKIENENDCYELIENLEVKSFNLKNKKFENKKVTHIYRRKINEKVVKWKFNLNKFTTSEIITTLDHKLLGIHEDIDCDDFIWTSYKDREESDLEYLVAYPEREEDKGQKYIGFWTKHKYGEFEKGDLINFKGYVYDLTVEDNHNFVANDIVVHNSYTMGSIAEGLADLDVEISKNLAFVLLDTMGVYWSMKYENKKEEAMLKEWGLEGKGLGVQIYVPGGFYNKYKEDGIPVDFPLYIRPNELSIEDWMNAFKLTTDNPIAVGIQRVVNKMLAGGKNFEIEEILELTQKDERLNDETKFAIINRFENVKTWGIFSKTGTPIRDIFTGGKVTVLDLSPYVAMPGGWEVKALTLGIIAKKIFVERMLVRKREELFDIVNKTQVIKKENIEDDLPMPWLIVDEAHEFLPNGEIVPSSQALMTILREGRQPGVSLILATQQPGKIHTDAITQSDIVLSHRITASFDLEALDKIFLSYDSKGSKALFNKMPRTKGCAIIMDDKNERLHTMQVKPRVTWHGGEDPNAIREVKDEFDFD